MRVGFLQFEPRLGDASYNLRIIRRTLAGETFDLIVLPELCQTGYLLGTRERAMQLAEPVRESATVRGLIELAANTKAHIVAGIAERDAGSVYNSAVLVGPSGLKHCHRKVHLPPYEAGIFDRGDRFDVCQAGDATVGIALGFETWIPEVCRELVIQRGAEIVASPANFGGPLNTDVAKLRALENVCYVVSANRIGVEQNDESIATFRGGSLIAGCDGDVLFQAGKQECVAVVDISPERARVKRNVMTGDLMGELARYRCRADSTLGINDPRR